LRNGIDEYDFCSNQLNLLLNSSKSGQGMQNESQQLPIEVIYLAQSYLYILFKTEDMRGYGSNSLNYTHNTNDLSQVLGWKLSSDPLTQGSYTESSFSAKIQPFELSQSFLDRAECWLQHM
jgi:hypothetical protein